jgi:hypothetical protein
MNVGNQKVFILEERLQHKGKCYLKGKCYFSEMVIECCFTPYSFDDML